MTIIKIVMVRHGESQWNKENRFTGWYDINLSKKGIKEAKHAGNILKKKGFIFDYVYTSVLKRAIHTVWNILDELNQVWLPVEKSWKLNERHYGSLQGLNKTDVSNKYGYEQVKQWRRSFTAIPPALSRIDEPYSGYDERYIQLTEKYFPLTESLAMTINRVIPYWRDHIFPRFKNGERILIIAHGNSLRALIKYLDNLDENAIINLNIPTGIPLIYEFNENFKPIRYSYIATD